MDRLELYHKIQLPENAIARLLEVRREIPTDVLEKFSVLLCSPADYAHAEQDLKTILSPDPDGFKILFVMLESALISYRKYQQRGISEEIYLATMKGFTRVLHENFAAFHKLTFDRSWWMGRLLSLVLFRIGELEYELFFETGTPMISMHIPSDAKLAQTDESIAKSRKFLKTFFPDYENAPYFCQSWLMSPAIPKLLDQSSRLLGFWKKFEITDFQPEDESYKWWVFQSYTINPKDFSEKTSLQRAIKQYVLSGEKIGEAKGILKN